MRANVTTTTNHTPADMTAEMQRIAAAVEGATLRALRRVGGEAIQWNRETGTRIDTRALASRSALPSARVFGRKNTGAHTKPPVGVVLLIDDSGSMKCTTKSGNERADEAAAVAAGLASACAALRVPILIGRHDEAGAGRVRLQAYYNTQDMIRSRQTMRGGNRDAFAVAGFANACEFPAERTLFVLIADGQPTDTEHAHGPAAAAALGTLARRRAAFAYAYIGNSSGDVDRAKREWGARRVFETRDPSALTRTLVAALADARSR